jgi:uroporphyrinogen III methyltransferase/synthase
MKKGIVYLIGAGPGDPELLTIKAMRIIRKADVVVFDRLVNSEIIEHASEDAELIYVGKKPGKHALSQDSINELLVQKALEGKVVARLKGGDPFLFGRGGEEALHLISNECDFEVVPGVTSAIAVPAYAGIPVTHRDLSSSFAVITGHEKQGGGKSSIHWKEIAKGIDTIVFLMGVENLSNIVERLMENGKPPDIPAALIRSGTLPEQEVITGTLRDIVSRAEERSFKSPAVFIVGQVVKLREKINWAEKKALRGQRIVITRPGAQADSFAERITELGGVPVRFPTIEIIKEKNLDKLYKAFENISGFDWVIFTSVNAVDIFFDELEGQGLDARVLKGIKICSIGPNTDKKLRQRGGYSSIVPNKYCANGIIDALKEKLQPGGKVLLPRARGAGNILSEGLSSLGAEVEEIWIYKSAVPSVIENRSVQKIINGDVDVITFTSSSTVINFVDIIGKENIKKIASATHIACIGPVTSDTARSSGFTVNIEAEQYTIDGLLEAMASKLKKRPV